MHHFFFALRGFQAVQIIVASILTALLCAPPQLAVIHFPLLLSAPIQAESFRVDDSPRIEPGLLFLDCSYNRFDVGTDVVFLFREIAEHAGRGDAMVEEWRFDFEAWLDGGEGRWDKQCHVEDARVQVRH